MKKVICLAIACVLVALFYLSRRPNGEIQNSYDRSVDLHSEELPPTRLPEKASALPPPKEWARDISDLAEEFEMPEGDAMSLLMESGEIVTLETPVEFHSGFSRIRIEGGDISSQKESNALIG